jgi:hypothetical protein
VHAALRHPAALFPCASLPTVEWPTGREEERARAAAASREA